MRIYLAGKVSEGLGDWRNHLLGFGYRWDPDSRRNVEVPLWHLPRDLADTTYLPTDEDAAWPAEPNRLVLGLHHYTGPWRVTFPREDWKYKGLFHGVEMEGGHGVANNPEIVAQRCMERIAESDLVFAYINACDAYGTIAEIGAARALGKYVVVVEAPEAVGEDDYDSLWFVRELGNAGTGRGLPSWEARTREDVGEAAWLRDKLLLAIASCAARPVELHRDWRQVAQQSYQQILRWTSDPRVRDEARRMMRLLAGVA